MKHKHIISISIAIVLVVIKNLVFFPYTQTEDASSQKYHTSPFSQEVQNGAEVPCKCDNTPNANGVSECDLIGLCVQPYTPQWAQAVVESIIVLAISLAISELAFRRKLAK